MDFLKIIYREKEYLLEDLQEESNDFSKGLLLPLDFKVKSIVTDVGLQYDKGYAIAGEKFRDLYSVLASARFALINAHTKIHKSGITWESGYSGQMWLRSQFLQNSILWYNSCEDYFLQVIWFAFDFYSDLKDYEGEMRKCKFEKIKNKLENYEDSTKAKLLLNSLLNYREDINVKRIREISNLIKHKQLIKFIGLDNQRTMSINSLDFNSKWIDPKVIDIDIAINELSLVHNSIVNLGIFLFEFTDFDGMFPMNENGRIPWGENKPKKEYKKISISEDYAL